MTWAKLKPADVLSAISSSSTVEEAAARISKLRNSSTTWQSISRQWRRWREAGLVNGKALDFLRLENNHLPEPVNDNRQPETILVIPDTQVKPGVPINHLGAAGKLAKEEGCDGAVHLGDHWDLPSFSSYESSLEKGVAKRSRKADIDAGNKALELFEEGLGNHKIDKWLLEGNHDGFAREGRIGRWQAENPWDADLITLDMFADSYLDWQRVPFLQPLEVSGVLFCHLFPFNKLGNVTKNAMRMGSTPMTALKYNMQNCIAGHKQGLEIAQTVTRKQILRSIVAGSFYQHDEPYLGPQKYWRGVLILRNCRKDNPFSFDIEEWSMERLLKVHG